MSDGGAGALKEEQSASGSDSIDEFKLSGAVDRYEGTSESGASPPNDEIQDLGLLSGEDEEVELLQAVGCGAPLHLQRFQRSRDAALE